MVPTLARGGGRRPPVGGQRRRLLDRFVVAELIGHPDLGVPPPPVSCGILDEPVEAGAEGGGGTDRHQGGDGAAERGPDRDPPTGRQAQRRGRNDASPRQGTGEAVGREAISAGLGPDGAEDRQSEERNDGHGGADQQTGPSSRTPRWAPGPADRPSGTVPTCHATTPATAPAAT